jgi:nucleotide-binding universal stress UspA family protein
MKLLVATDLSARSDRAAERAVQLARTHDAALIVLHVVDENLPPAAIEQVASTAEAEVRSFLGRLIPQHDLPSTVRVVVGNHFRQILETADREACDAIVLGRHRNESCEAAFGGTTMGRVVRMGHRPVLVVSQRTEGPYRNVMIGADFSGCSRRAMRAAFAIAPGAAFHLVHAFDVPFEGFLPGSNVRREVGEEHDEVLSRLADEEVGTFTATSAHCRFGRPRIEKVLRQGEVIGVLRHEVASLRAELLAIGTHGRSGLSRAVLGSVAQDLVDRPPCDVLVVKDNADS